MKISKYIVILAGLIISSGCATALVEEVRDDESRLSSLQRELAVEEAALSNLSSDVYFNGECRLSSRSQRPPQVCDNDSAAEKAGMAACLVGYGCAAAILTFKEGMSSAQEKWVATEGCSTAARLANDKGYTPDQTLYNVVVAGVDTSCESEGVGFWGKLRQGASCAVAYTMALERGLAFSNCVTREANRCEVATEEWLNGPTRRLAECNESTASIQNTRNESSRLRASITKRKDTLTWRLFGD